MRYVLEANCEVGPALLLDEQFRGAWAELTFDEAVLGGRFEEAGLRGECCYLKNEGARQFSGSVVVLIDEPAPALVRYASRQATSLLLQVPTGRLRLMGLRALIKDGGLPPGEEDLLTVDVTPGRYLVDAYDFVEQAARLENRDALLPEEDPLPGEQPPTRWTGPLRWTRLALAALTFLGPLFFVVFWRLPPALVGAGVALGLLWAALFMAFRVSGERERVRHNAALWKAHLARLPELPDYVLVLRPAGPEALSAEGGGLP